MIQKTQNTEIDLLQLIVIIWRKRWLVAFCSVMTTCIGVFYYFGSSDTFSANVSIQVGGEKKNALSLETLYAFAGGSSDNYDTQIELIKSRKLLSRVVDKLNLTEEILDERDVSNVEALVNGEYQLYLAKSLPYLVDYAPFLAAYLTKGDEKKSTLDPKVLTTKKLQEMVSASNVSSSQFIVINVKAYSPELATNIVNAIADVFIVYHFEERQTVNEGASAWLVNELETIKLDIVQAEKELQSFSESEDLVDIQGVMGLKAEELKELSRQRTELEQKIDEQKIQYQAMEEITDPSVLLDTIEITPSSSIGESLAALTLVESEFLEVSLRYGPKHPAYILAKENVSVAKKKLHGQVFGLVKVNEVELRKEEKKLERLLVLFSAAKLEFQELTKLERLFRQKAREVQTHQELYANVLRRLQETQAISGLDQEFATVFDYALADDAINISKRTIVLVASIIPGIIIGALLSLFLGLIGQKVWNVDELRRFTNIPVLGCLSKIKSKKKQSKSKPYYQFTNDRIYLENIDTLRTRLLASHKSERIISITSAMPEEGKSTIALHLSHAFSKLEKVLVIDADLRRPSITKMVGLSHNHPGLSDILAREAKLSECIVRNQAHGFDFLSAGRSLTNSNSLLSSTIMPKLLEGLARYYDRIIIETAPIHLFSDAEVVAKLVDGVLIVVKVEDTLKKDIKASLDKLERVGANLIGSILNQANTTTERYHYQKYILDDTNQSKKSDQFFSTAERVSTKQITFTKKS